MLTLVHPSEAHEEVFLAATRGSRDLHAPWVSPPLDAEGFRAYVARCAREDFEGLFVMHEDGGLVGEFNLSQIFRGGFQNAYMGYWANQAYAGRGLMRRGMALVLDHTFGPLGLHRVEANIQPGNTASIALVRRVGFRREGFSPRYLHIDGAWRDHERWAMTAEDWLQGR